MNQRRNQQAGVEVERRYNRRVCIEQIIVGLSTAATTSNARAQQALEEQIAKIVDVSTRPFKYFEPFIAANPAQRGNLVLLSSKYLSRTKNSRKTEPAAWFSTDGGRRWEAGKFLGIEKLKGDRSSFGNPHASFTKDGIAYAVYTGHGRLYALSHSQTAEPPGLHVRFSTDGTSWSSPKQIQAVDFGCIAYAGIAVSPRGVLGVCWMQCGPRNPVRPNDKKWTAQEHQWNLYFAASDDGGMTFSSPTAILQSSYRTDATVARWPFGGEYVAMTATDDGRFHVAWINTTDGVGTLQTASIRA